MDDKHLQHYGILGMKWGTRRSRKKTKVHTDYKKAHDKKSIKSMSDSELKARNNRLNMEKQYNDLTRKKSKGKVIVQSFIASAGTIAAAEGAYKTYKRIADKAVSAIGDQVTKEVSKGFSKGM